MPDFLRTAARLSPFVCAAFGVVAVPSAHAAAASTSSTSAAVDVAANEQKFAEDLAREHGLKTQDVLDVLAKARYQQSVIDTMTRPAEAKPWKEYRPIFVTDRRIADGIAFYRANAPLLKRVEKEYGVPASLIVTIIGVETNYGRNSGHYRVLDALTTLAFYYPPRQDFFRGELKQLLLLKSASFPYPPDELMGSYAGAMGWGQFMPSSIAKFARDGDGDGKVDLWNSLPDICASIANYFVAHGWQKDGPVAVRASVAATARALTPASLEPVYPLQQLGEWGYTDAGKTDPAKSDKAQSDQSRSDQAQSDQARTDQARTDPMTPATIVTLEGEAGPEVWITFENFYSISRYNKSPLYSLAVYQLSQAIAAGVDAAPP